MQKEYRKLYYRLLPIPPVHVTGRKTFIPARWLCPFARKRRNGSQSNPFAAPRQEILIVYRDETLSEH